MSKQKEARESRKAAEARESLQAAANFLLKTPKASKKLKYVATAIQEFLDGKHETLDHAVGLKLGRGKYERQDSQFHLDLVYDAACMCLFDEMSFEAVSAKIGYDPSDFRPIYDRYLVLAVERIYEENKAALSDLSESQGVA